MWSVIVNDLNDDNGPTVIVPAELQDQSPLVIEPDRMLSGTVTPQLLEPGTLEVAKLALATDRSQ
jgi:hypothetical protein